MIRFDKSVPPKLLVIHEHPVLRAQARKHLESSGYTVVEAGSCKEAIAIMHTCTFAGIIVDNEMADYEAASPLSARSTTGNSNIPCIILATNRVIRKPEKDFNTALDDYLYKPFRPSALAKHVHEVIKTAVGSAHLRLVCPAVYALTGTTGINLTKFNLPSKQMILLHTLVSNSPRAVSKACFVDVLYSHKSPPINPYNAVESLVFHLRKRLRAEESNVSIKSVRGVGYRASINHRQNPIITNVDFLEL
ncbi:MAG: winged helix-turn-helix domain-containing protein [Pseudomonas sp.]|nr:MULTISPECIES: response regulator [unclassified Pseudomonas]MCR4508069.1 winged helix-turn-helix domain-containing protein [Pseudomonas sp. 32.2.56]MDO9619970.1 winged helix-turn-helix domain-containing protein [Pseudomonas sp.]MDP2443951.1 winged helix-turn-helix domain-containing protein [Pseudomonas sp.]